MLLYPDLAWADECWRGALDAPVSLAIDEWVDAGNYLLPRGNAEPGRYRIDRTPYVREIIRALSAGDPTEVVALMACAQSGKSEIALATIGHSIAVNPRPMMLVQPTVETLKAFAATRVGPMLEGNPKIARLIPKSGPRKSGNKSTFKKFPGGFLHMAGANSGASLRAMAVALLCFDEVDAAPIELPGEGDPVAIAIRRTATYAGRRKVLLTSTPTTKGISRIEDAFEDGDQCRYFVPCQHCGHMFAPVFEDLIWPQGEPHKAELACPSCGGLHAEADKGAMLAAGEWRATATPRKPLHRSFHISGLISPFLRWSEIAVDFVAAKGKPEKLQAWRNLILGEPWIDEETTPIEIDALRNRAEAPDDAWTDILPPEVCLLTLGADVQADRIEAELVGWSLHEQSWSIAYLVFAGDTSGPHPWAALDDYLRRTFRHSRAAPDLRIAAACVDAGFRTDAVVDFCGRRAARRVYAVKGVGGAGIPVFPRVPPKPRRGRLSGIYRIGVDSLKRTLMDRLKLPTPSYA
jgi:phage terminase large subunit GpA-like protein